MLEKRFDAFYVAVECKNTNEVEPDAVSQLTSYLRLPVGRFGLLVSRKPAKDKVLRRARVFLSGEQKLILHLADEDLLTLIKCGSEGRGMSELLRRRYEKLSEPLM